MSIMQQKRAIILTSTEVENAMSLIRYAQQLEHAFEQRASFHTRKRKYLRSPRRCRRQLFID